MKNNDKILLIDEEALLLKIASIIDERLNTDWLSLSNAAKYIGVSYNTFIKFRTLGLKVCEIDGIKRVSKKEIDRFLEEYSY